MNAHEIILEAAKVVGDREGMYGTKYENHLNIAKLWNAYLGDKIAFDEVITPEDVALMMVLLKIARTITGYREDNYVDIAGYAGCAGEIARFTRGINSGDNPSEVVGG